MEYPSRTTVQSVVVKIGPKGSTFCLDAVSPPFTPYTRSVKINIFPLSIQNGIKIGGPVSYLSLFLLKHWLVKMWL
jgi:hypothetical protein